MFSPGMQWTVCGRVSPVCAHELVALDHLLDPRPPRVVGHVERRGCATSGSRARSGASGRARGRPSCSGSSRSGAARRRRSGIGVSCTIRPYSASTTARKSGALDAGALVQAGEVEELLRRRLARVLRRGVKRRGVDLCSLSASFLNSTRSTSLAIARTSWRDRDSHGRRRRCASGTDPYLGAPSALSCAADRPAQPFPRRPGERYWRLMEPTPFVGRAEEFERLERALRRAQSGVGSTVLVAGEAGIGKTRLASELATRARAAGFEVLVGRCIDLVGTELPYQPFADALRPRSQASALPGSQVRPAGSQLRVFEETLALLSGLRGRRARAARARGSALGRHVDARSRRLPRAQPRRAARCCCSRPTAPMSSRRPSACAGLPTASGARARRSCSSSARSSARSWRRCSRLARGAPPPRSVTDAIVARSEGNPFFAEELLAAAGRPGGELPRSLRDLLLQRVARLDRRTQGLLRLAAAAGRDVDYPLLRDAAALPERDVRESLRRAVEHGVLVPDQATGSFRFRHALLAEAIYATLLPGEREELHARLADELARGEPPASAAELAPHWAAAGRSRGGARRVGRGGARGGGRLRPGRGSARTSSGRSRCGPPCRTQPQLAGLDLAELCVVGGASSPARPAPRRAPSSSARRADRARRRRRSGCAPRSCTSASAATCSTAAAATPASPRASARSSSCRRSRPRRRAHRCWRRSGTD